MTSRLWNVLIVLLVTLTFVPYIAIPLGSNTNIPLSSIVSLAFVAWMFKRPKLLFPLLATLSIPLVFSFFRIVLGLGETSSAAIVVSVFHMLPLAGFCAAIIINESRVRSTLAFAICASSVYAITQKFVFLDQGAIPFLSYYRTPGYASVEAQADTIVQYIKRPFGLFPESSFMAGSIALALVLLLLLSASSKGASQIRLVVPMSTGMVAIYLSDSGSGLVSISLLLVAYFWFYGSGISRGAWIGVSAVIGIIVGSQILSSRNTVNNWSWDDRAASIVGAGRYLLSDIFVLFLGAGRGATPKLFAQGEIPLEGLTYFHVLPDVYSVLMRILLELGMVAGGIICLYLASAIFFASHALFGKVAAVCFVALWITVAGLTISYDSAAWIWALPGAALGLWSKHRSSLVLEKADSIQHENLICN